MKQPAATMSEEYEESRPKRKFQRQPINRILRTSLILLTLLLLAATILAGYAALRPVVLNWPRNVFEYSRSSDVTYQVETSPNPISGNAPLGMGQVYADAYTKAIVPVFKYNWQADRSMPLKWQSQVITKLRVKDQADPTRILFEKSAVVAPAEAGSATARSFAVERGVRVDLAPYRQLIQAFKTQSSLKTSFDLLISLQTTAQTDVEGGPFEVVDLTTLTLPLDTATFEIGRTTIAEPSKILQRQLQYQLTIAAVPFFVYPIIGGLLLILLALLLTLTCAPQKNQFERQIRKMMRQARPQLMVIGDKAWEPEWCITTRDFRAMVQTARKLKHPIFCFVDRQAKVPTAYFYVYYGENNYCHTYCSPITDSVIQNEETSADNMDDGHPDDHPDDRPGQPPGGPFGGPQAKGPMLQSKAGPETNQAASRPAQVSNGNNWPTSIGQASTGLKAESTTGANDSALATSYHPSSSLPKGSAFSSSSGSANKPSSNSSSGSFISSAFCSSSGSATGSTSGTAYGSSPIPWGAANWPRTDRSDLKANPASSSVASWSMPVVNGTSAAVLDEDSPENVLARLRTALNAR